MGHVNLIWQGDANARALQCLTLADSPATILNVTGRGGRLHPRSRGSPGRLAGRQPRFNGTEAADALLSNAARSIELFGPPAMDAGHHARSGPWTGCKRGGRVLDKPTHFEEREGRF